jgi:hypothetical protein
VAAWKASPVPVPGGVVRRPDVPPATYKHVEHLAAQCRRKAGLRKGDYSLSSLTIARLVIGRPVQLNPKLATEACYFSDLGIIALRELGPHAHFAVAHELGHHMMRSRREFFVHEEHLANHCGRALVGKRAAAKAAAEQERA